MGIPGLFRSCIQKYNESSKDKVIQIDVRNGRNHLFLDFNCAIYYVLKPEMKTNETLIIHTIEYLDTLCKLIPNLDTVYIALDGVPPRAKMEQQRSRRFHSVCKKKKALNINTKYGNHLDKTNYNFNLDTNMITPGTVFMKELSLAIRKHLSDNNFYDNKKIIFSDSSMPGEGEHKILDYIRENNINEDDNIIIYGLDGDLIMLSLVSQRSNLYLLREAVQYGGYAKHFEGHKYLFLNIDNLYKSILLEFQSSMVFELDYEKGHRYIDDYIFLCFILGNDFVPKIHWYSLYDGGHDKLINIYFEIHNNTEEFLVDRTNMTINRIILMDIFQMLSLNENYAIKKLFKKREKLRIPVKEDMSERERQQLLVDFYPLQYLDVEKNIDPYSPKWRQRYYKTCFQFNNNPDNIKMVTNEYLKTLVWNFHYYFKECPDWDFYYPFHYSPTTADIYYAIENIKQTDLKKAFDFNKNKPIEPQTLLLMVLPNNSSSLMAIDIHNHLLKGNEHLSIYFPKKYTLNVAFHKYYYECTANIPKMKTKFIEKFIKDNCKLTNDELERNKKGELFIKNKS